jgi:hypothetical protein
MNWNWVLVIIIVMLAIGWMFSVYQGQENVNKVKKLYNKLVFECNKTILANQISDFCIDLPNGTQLCNQQDLNSFLPFNEP